MRKLALCLLLPVLFGPTAIRPALGAENQYRLTEGDTITVDVWELPQLGGTRAVRPDGDITLPLLGSVPAKGLTVAELSAAIAQRLNEFLVAPRVSVDLIAQRPAKSMVYVVGAVARPGSYDLVEGAGVLEALALAGGALPAADRTGVSVLRAAARVATVDVSTVEKGTQEGSAPPGSTLQAGDVVVVPAQELRTVAVLGSVRAPGLLEVEGELAVLAAVTRAEGTTEDADLANATLTRSDGTVEKVELEKLYRQGELARNVLLHPGDSLFVPFRKGRVTVAGVVREPGNFPALAPLTYAEALAAAGGAGEHADLAHVVHAGEDGTSRVVDVEALLQGPSGEPSRPVRPGDTLYVPELRSVVSVVGRVETPGSYLLLPGQRVLSVLPHAGRILEDADLAAATLTRRDGTVVPLALAALLEDGNVEANVVLQADDVITIPRYARRLFVLGSVHAPGSYRLAPEDGILDAIDHAGGFGQDPDLGRSVVVRQQPEAEPEVIKVDLGARVTRGDLSQEVALLDGDILFVPGRRNRFAARNVIDYLFGLDLIRRIVRKE